MHTAVAMVRGQGFEAQIDEVRVVSQGRAKCDSLHYLVLLLRVTSGKLQKNEAVIIEGTSGKIEDIILRIECNKTEIFDANIGDDIGVCLKSSSVEGFLGIGIPITGPPERIYCP